MMTYEEAIAVFVKQAKPGTPKELELAEAIGVVAMKVLNDIDRIARALECLANASRT